MCVDIDSSLPLLDYKLDILCDCFKMFRMEMNFEYFCCPWGEKKRESSRFG